MLLGISVSLYIMKYDTDVCPPPPASPAPFAVLCGIIKLNVAE